MKYLTSHLLLAVAAVFSLHVLLRFWVSSEEFSSSSTLEKSKNMVHEAQGPEEKHLELVLDLYDTSNTKKRENDVETDVVQRLAYSEGKEVAEKDFVHIVYAPGDASQYVGLKASINSLLQNSKSARHIVVHLFFVVNATIEEDNKEEASTIEAKLVPKELDCIVEKIRSAGASLKVHQFTKEDVEKFNNPHNDRGNLQSPGNYVRYILPERLSFPASQSAEPSLVELAVWMDNDTIILGDIVSFLRSLDLSKKPLAAFPRPQTDMKKARKQLKKLGAILPKEDAMYFNAGVIVMNLTLWSEQNCTERILQFCDWNREYNLWPDYGSQPPLQMTFGGDGFQHLDSSLYLDRLGCQKCSRNMTDSAFFLHWNGLKKPWKAPYGKLREQWQPYDMDGTS